MESSTSDLTVVPNQEGAESSMVLAPSIHASLQRTSSVVSENIAAGDDGSAGVEPSLPVASSKNSEIIEVEDDPSLGMDPIFQSTSSLLDPAEDGQSSGTGSTSSTEMEVNPFIKSGAKYESNALVKHYSALKQKLKDGLQKESVYAFLEHNNMMEAQEKVQELFYLFEAIEFVTSNVSTLLKIPASKTKPSQPNFEADYRLIDIYNHLFIHALNYATQLPKNSSIGLTHSHSMIVDYLSEYFKATDFMVFLINKVQEDNMYPSLALHDNWSLITECIHRYEEETISTFICLVVNDKDDKDEEAKDLFQSLLEHMKPSDIINRGRVYNYALQKAQDDLRKVHKFLSSPSLSLRYKVVVQCNNRLNGLAMEYDNQVKVYKFLVDLYLKDDLNQKIDWEFVEQYDYPYLISCLWECHNRMVPNDVSHYNWTPLQLNYVFTSSAAMTIGRNDIMERFLEAWPTLVNTSYKGVAALHAAVLKGNEEVIEYLLMQKELDINVRTSKNNNRWNLPTYQTALHIATAQGHVKVVKLLCDAPEPHQQRLRCHEEDEEGHAPLDILYGGPKKVVEDFDFSRIEKILSSKPDVQNAIDKLYRDRQVLVDAVNTILVGAALIASVTFVGWLQPPLGYVQYYDLAVPYPAPPDTYDSYLAVQGNLGVKAFVLFNSLSFFFAIATVIVGADAAFPKQRHQYIGHVIETMDLLLRRAVTFLIVSLVCVLGAFGSAAIAVLPPSLFFRKDLVLSIIIGGGVCGYALWQLLLRHSAIVQRLNAQIANIAHIIRFTNVF